jgi:diguanylate cyclase (GGDEF)-like protein
MSAVRLAIPPLARDRGRLLARFLVILGGLLTALLTALPVLQGPEAVPAPSAGPVPVTLSPRISVGLRAEPSPPPGGMAGTAWGQVSLHNPGGRVYEGYLAFMEPARSRPALARQEGPWLQTTEATRAHRIWTVPVTLAPGASATYWIRGEHSGERFPLELWTRPAFTDAVARVDWALGLLFGIIIALTLYALFSASAAESIWRPFAGFLAATAAVTYVNLGYAHGQWGHLAQAMTQIRLPLYFLGLAALSAFGRHFLFLGRDLPRVAQAFRGLEVGLLVSTLGAGLGLEIPVLYSRALIAVVAVISAVLGLRQARRGCPQAVLYVAGWLPMAGLAVQSILRRVGVLELGQYAEPPYILGTVASVLLFTFAVAERVASERRAHSDALADSERRYAYAARGSNDGLFDWDLAQGEIFLAPRLYETMGLPQGSLGSDPRRVLEAVLPEDRAALERRLRTALGDPKQESVQVEARLQVGDEARWFLLRGLVVRDDAQRAVRLVGSVADNHARKLNELELARRAFSDEVTGLPNRARVAQHLSTLLEIREQQPDLSFAVLFVDLDRFKNVNDSLGHLVGDQLLATLGRRLSLVAREEDMVGRLGGDEFVLVAAGRVTVDDAERIGRRILEVLEAPVTLEGIEIRSSASIGIAHSDAGYASVEALLSDADLAMYEAKHSGKGRCVTFQTAMREQAVVRLSMEADLRQAVDRDELVLFYQPIVMAHGAELAGFEALIRWRHPRRGLVSPAEFIPVAEETGLIRAIGRLALLQAAGQLARWRAEAPERDELFVTVNVSPAQFGHHLVEDVKAALATSGIPARCLRLEITESLFVGESGQVKAEVDAICALGVHFSLDDFGTGYSSLSYLHRLPFRTLKIDRSFMRNLLDDPQSEAIVRSVLALARALGLETVAEGVETAAVAERLRTLGTSYLQGYYFSKPLPPQEIELRRAVPRSA